MRRSLQNSLLSSGRVSASTARSTALPVAAHASARLALPSSSALSNVHVTAQQQQQQTRAFSTGPPRLMQPTLATTTEHSNAPNSNLQCTNPSSSSSSAVNACITGTSDRSQQLAGPITTPHRSSNSNNREEEEEAFACNYLWSSALFEAAVDQGLPVIVRVFDRPPPRRPLTPPRLVPYPAPDAEFPLPSAPESEADQHQHRQQQRQQQRRAEEAEGVTYSRQWLSYASGADLTARHSIGNPIVLYLDASNVCVDERRMYFSLVDARPPSSPPSKRGSAEEDTAASGARSGEEVEQQSPAANPHSSDSSGAAALESVDMYSQHTIARRLLARAVANGPYVRIGTPRAVSMALEQMELHRLHSTPTPSSAPHTLALGTVDDGSPSDDGSGKYTCGVDASLLTTAPDEGEAAFELLRCVVACDGIISTSLHPCNFRDEVATAADAAAATAQTEEDGTSQTAPQHDGGASSLRLGGRHRSRNRPQLELLTALTTLAFMGGARDDLRKGDGFESFMLSATQQTLRNGQPLSRDSLEESAATPHAAEEERGESLGASTGAEGEMKRKDDEDAAVDGSAVAGAADQLTLYELCRWADTDLRDLPAVGVTDDTPQRTASSAKALTSVVSTITGCDQPAADKTSSSSSSLPRAGVRSLMPQWMRSAYSGDLSALHSERHETRTRRLSVCYANNSFPFRIVTFEVGDDGTTPFVPSLVTTGADTITAVMEQLFAGRAAIAHGVPLTMSDVDRLVFADDDPSSSLPVEVGADNNNSSTNTTSKRSNASAAATAMVASPIRANVPAIRRICEGILCGYTSFCPAHVHHLTAAPTAAAAAASTSTDSAAPPSGPSSSAAALSPAKRLFLRSSEATHSILLAGLLLTERKLREVAAWAAPPTTSVLSSSSTNAVLDSNNSEDAIRLCGSSSSLLKEILFEVDADALRDLTLGLRLSLEALVAASGGATLPEVWGIRSAEVISGRIRNPRSAEVARSFLRGALHLASSEGGGAVAAVWQFIEEAGGEGEGKGEGGIDSMAPVAASLRYLSAVSVAASFAALTTEAHPRGFAAVGSGDTSSSSHEGLGGVGDGADAPRLLSAAECRALSADAHAAVARILALYPINPSDALRDTASPSSLSSSSHPIPPVEGAAETEVEMEKGNLQRQQQQRAFRWTSVGEPSLALVRQGVEALHAAEGVSDLLSRRLGTGTAVDVEELAKSSSQRSEAESAVSPPSSFFSSSLPPPTIADGPTAAFDRFTFTCDSMLEEGGSADRTRALRLSANDYHSTGLRPQADAAATTRFFSEARSMETDVLRSALMFEEANGRDVAGRGGAPFQCGTAAYVDALLLSGGAHPSAPEDAAAGDAAKEKRDEVALVPLTAADASLSPPPRPDWSAQRAVAAGRSLLEYSQLRQIFSARDPNRPLIRVSEGSAARVLRAACSPANNFAFGAGYVAENSQADALLAVSAVASRWAPSMRVISPRSVNMFVGKRIVGGAVLDGTAPPPSLLVGSVGTERSSGPTSSTASDNNKEKSSNNGSNSSGGSGGGGDAVVHIPFFNPTSATNEFSARDGETGGFGQAEARSLLEANQSALRTAYLKNPFLRGVTSLRRHLYLQRALVGSQGGAKYLSSCGSSPMFFARQGRARELWEAAAPAAALCAAAGQSVASVIIIRRRVRRAATPRGIGSSCQPPRSPLLEAATVMAGVRLSFVPIVIDVDEAALSSPDSPQRNLLVGLLREAVGSLGVIVADLSASSKAEAEQQKQLPGADAGAIVEGPVGVAALLNATAAAHGESAARAVLQHQLRRSVMAAVNVDIGGLGSILLRARRVPEVMKDETLAAVHSDSALSSSPSALPSSSQPLSGLNVNMAALSAVQNVSTPGLERRLFRAASSPRSSVAVSTFHVLREAQLRGPRSADMFDDHNVLAEEACAASYAERRAAAGLGYGAVGQLNSFIGATPPPPQPADAEDQAFAAGSSSSPHRGAPSGDSSDAHVGGARHDSSSGVVGPAEHGYGLNLPITPDGEIVVDVAGVAETELHQEAPAISATEDSEDIAVQLEEDGTAGDRRKASGRPAPSTIAAASVALADRRAAAGRGAPAEEQQAQAQGQGQAGATTLYNSGPDRTQLLIRFADALDALAVTGSAAQGSETTGGEERKTPLAERRTHPLRLSSAPQTRGVVALAQVLPFLLDPLPSPPATDGTIAAEKKTKGRGKKARAVASSPAAAATSHVEMADEEAFEEVALVMKGAFLFPFVAQTPEALWGHLQV